MNTGKDAAYVHVIADELKELRKGQGLAGNVRPGRDTLLGAAVDYDPTGLVVLLKSELQTLGTQNRDAMLNALSLNRDVPVTADLTVRRANLAEKLQASERTIVRYEDAAIQEMSRLLADKFATQREYCARIEQNYRPLPDLTGPVSRFVSQSSASRALPDDLTGMVQAQAETIEQLGGVVAALGAQLDALKKMNVKMAKMLGI